MKNLLLFLMLLAGIPPRVTAQQEQDSIPARLKNRQLQNGQQGLYLHTDKTVYTHNEAIWFTAYQLDSLPGEQNTLFVFLQNTGDRKIVYTARYVMENYRSHGYLFLPGWLPEGDYCINAYTNIQLRFPGKQVTRQYIRLRSDTEKPYVLQYKPGDNYRDARGLYHLVYTLRTKQGAVVNQGKIKYQLLDEQGKKESGRLSVPASGILAIPVPEKMQRQSVQAYVTMLGNKDTQTFYFPASNAAPPLIRFYPESGRLIAGVKNRVAFELSGNIKPDSFRALLMENGKELFALTADASGMGSFEITPGEGSIYSLQSGTHRSLTYDFPATASEGFRLALASGVIEDRLSLNISGT